MLPKLPAKRVVIKLGTGVLTTGIGQLDIERIQILCNQVNSLQESGTEVIVVSSGAVGLGMGKLGLQRRPKDLATLQACAAVGQGILINTWQQCFDAHAKTVAQILLTREDLRAKHRHNAIFNTVECLLANGVVPIVNENDTISATEIKFGDNDTLSALVASVINADLLFILSNIPGLIDMAGTQRVVPYVEKITPEIDAMAQGTHQVTSVGGMVSKLSAAKIAHRAGCGVIIGNGKDDTLFDRFLSAESVGTYFAPSSEPVKPHKRWLAIQDEICGSITIDQGAANALQKAGKSLLFAGISSCEGDFEEGDVVAILDPNNSVIAQGITSVDIKTLQSAIANKESDARNHSNAAGLLSNVIVHRNHLALID